MTLPKASGNMQQAKEICDAVGASTGKKKKTQQPKTKASSGNANKRDKLQQSNNPEINDQVVAPNKRQKRTDQLNSDIVPGQITDDNHGSLNVATQSLMHDAATTYPFPVSYSSLGVPNNLYDNGRSSFTSTQDLSAMAYAAFNNFTASSYPPLPDLNINNTDLYSGPDIIPPGYVPASSLIDTASTTPNTDTNVAFSLATHGYPVIGTQAAPVITPVQATNALPMPDLIRPVPHIDDAANKLAENKDTYDCIVRNDEGNLRSYCHNLLMVQNGLTSWYARKQLPSHEQALLNGVKRYLDNKFANYNENWYTANDGPMGTLSFRLENMFINALTAQYGNTTNGVSTEKFHAECGLEARNWVLEKIQEFQDSVESQLEANEHRRTEKQKHTQLPCSRKK